MIKNKCGEVCEGEYNTEGGDVVLVQQRVGVRIGLGLEKVEEKCLRQKKKKKGRKYNKNRRCFFFSFDLKTTVTKKTNWFKKIN